MDGRPFWPEDYMLNLQPDRNGRGAQTTETSAAYARAKQPAGAGLHRR